MQTTLQFWEYVQTKYYDCGDFNSDVSEYFIEYKCDLDASYS